MSAPTFNATGISVTNLGALDLTGVVTDGQLLLLLCETSDGPVSCPGFTELSNSPQDVSGTTRLTAFYRIGQASDTTFTVSGFTDHIYGRCFRIDGQRASSPIESVVGGTKSSASTSLSVTGGSTSSADCLVIAVATRDNDAAAAAFSAWANSDLTGVAEVFDAGTAVGNGGGLGIATGTKAVAGAFGATTATIAVSTTDAFMHIVVASTGGAAPTLSSATFISDGKVDGVVLRTVWSAAVTPAASPAATISCAGRSISNAALTYKAGSGTDTIDWWVKDANNRIFSGDTVTVSFSAGDVSASGTGNDAITGHATTNSSAAAAYAPTYVRSIPFRVYADLHNQAAANVYGSPILPIQEFGPSEVDSLAHFQTAAATKLPVASGLANLDLEGLLPASGNYADFDTDASWPANLAILTSILDWAIANYPTHYFLPYPITGIYSAIAGAGSASARADRLLYASRSYSLVEAIGHSNALCAEFYDRDTSMDQAAMDAYAAYTMTQARAVNTLAYPRVVRRIYAIIYLNNPDSPFTPDFTAQRLAISIRALRRAGADGVVYAGSESGKDAAAWQRDAYTRQRQMVQMAGLLGSGERRSRSRGR